MKRILLLAVTGMVAAHGWAKPEITWSLMHPTPLDAAYMTRVCAKAAEYGNVDSFEICAECHSPLGGLNGLTTLEKYPKAHAKCDLAAIRKNCADLKQVVNIAHAAGKPVYYWHREVFIMPGVLDDVPSMLDETGEFDLLGEAYADFLRYKIAEAYRNVPELDGIVLTLTEASFSVLHSARPDRYPPAKVVERLVRLFAEEHSKRGKRLVLRSFGSVAKDYEDILAGAAAAAKDHAFEIETKITPYDFCPFLPPNPFLRRVPGTTIGAECDGLGEFLGAGYLPCCQTPVIRRYINEGQAKAADRCVIRIDRVGNSIFDSAQEVNLYAYMRFIRDPAATPEQVMDEWAAKRWAKCPDEMKRLSEMSFRLVRATQFVDENVIFHQNPPAATFKFIKACGILSVLRDGCDLHLQKDQWGIQHARRTPGRKAILAEKDEAVRLAQEGLALLESVKDRLDPDEYARQQAAWTRAAGATVATRALFRCLSAYFDDMEANVSAPRRLAAAVQAADREITARMKNPAADPHAIGFKNVRRRGKDLDLVYYAPLRWLCRATLDEFAAERAVRAGLLARREVKDFVVPGGLFDDNRIGRAMHASYSELRNGRPVRHVGNTIFPNGTVTVEFDAPAGATLEIGLDAASIDVLTVRVNGGAARTVRAEKGVARVPVGATGKVSVTLAKADVSDPRVKAIAARDFHVATETGKGSPYPALVYVALVR